MDLRAGLFHYYDLLFSRLDTASLDLCHYSFFIEMLKKRIVFQILVFAKEDNGDPDGDQQHSHPPLEADSFM
jgi:hypothetical protein